ncbi:MAG: nuclear transport factor 2 family protein [Candidatus Tectomicrobia bacterium]|nr:nuclear transport factor 2 family protein [Candidatus Tectomicrobia bacterium]
MRVAQTLSSRRWGLWLGFLAAAVLVSPAGVGAQRGPAQKGPAVGKPPEGLLRPRDLPSQKGLEQLRLQLQKMGWSEFWEREEGLWRRIEKQMKEAGEIDQRLLPLKKKKEEVLGRLRKLYWEKRPPSERMGDLLVLRDLSRSILPLAARRARASSEMKALMEEWLLFQGLAQELVAGESRGYQSEIATAVVENFIGAFKKGDVGAISALLFPGVRVNDQLDRRSYLRHLENYFQQVQVTSFEVKKRVIREVNPFTIRIQGDLAAEETEIVKDQKVKPRKKERAGPVSFTLKEVGGRWMIAEMQFPAGGM